MLTTRKRIVITGVGVISPIGIGKDAYWQAFKEGKSGIKPIRLFDTSKLEVKVGGEITEFNPKEILGRRGLVDLDRATTLLSSATKFALEDANLEINEANTRKIGISVGTTFGSLNSLSEFDRASLTEGPRFVNPSRFPNTVINSPASRAAIRFGVRGLNATVSTGFCAGLDSLDYALNLLNFNRVDKMIVGAVEEMCFQTFFGFYKLGYLSGVNTNLDPISCPFDKRRNGIVFSEGASVMILEELESALKRNAVIYAEILGIASNFDPYRLHKYNPKGTGMAEAMNLSLKNAKMKPQDIDCIFANANSTQDADRIETEAIKKVFGDYAKEIPVTAIKSMLGETFSASGGLSTIAAAGSINNNFIPPTINYKEKDRQCDLDYVLNEARKQKIGKVMINTFGPNGANTTLIIVKYDKS